METQTKEERISFSQKFFVGLGGIPYTTGPQVVQFMGQPFLQIILGMDPTLVGLLLMIPRFFDALSDPWMGYISDNFRSRWGRRRPFIVLGGLLMAIFFTLLWNISPTWSTTSQFIYFLCISLLFYLAYTIFSVPMVSLTYEMTRDYQEKTKMMAYWGFFVMAGNLALNWFWPMAVDPRFQTPFQGVKWVSAGIAIIIFFILGVLPGIYGKERYYDSCKDQSAIRFWDSIKSALSYQPMRRLIGLVLSLNICSTIASGMALYIVIYYVCGGDVVKGSTLNALNGTGFTIIGFTFIPLISSISKRCGKKQTLLIFLCIAAFGGLLKYFIFTPSYPYLLLFDALLNGPIWVCLSVLIPSMMSDLCDLDEYENGLRREGVFGSVFAWISKVGQSTTFLFSGIVLSLSGFNEKLGAHQSPEALLTLRLCFTGFSILAMIIGIAFLMKYQVNESLMTTVRTELHKRHAKR